MRLTPHKDDKLKYAEITPFQASSNLSALLKKRILNI
mgnify:CR=1 FL=1